MAKTDYSLIILGGGPAGLTAGLYASRARVDTLLVEKGVPGGQVLVTDWIDNYPGFPDGIAGYELIEKMTAQAQRFGLQIKNGTNVQGMDLSGPSKKLFLEGGGELSCKALIIATGARPRSLGVPGEKELTGKGVSYCATCDGPFYRGLDIVVIGGGDTAVQEGIHITKFAHQVTIVHRRDELRATEVIQEQAFANPKVNFVCSTIVVAIDGDSEVVGVKLQNIQSQAETSMVVQGVFVLIGTIPNNEMLPSDQLHMEDGFVVTDSEMRTNVPGVMAIGDIRSKAVRQVVNAAGEGAVATQAALHYLQSAPKG